MPVRWSIAPVQQLLAGVVIALVIARWWPVLAAAWLFIWAVFVYRRLLADWTAALRFHPVRLLTTPALLGGLIICLALLAAALFPALFAPYDPHYQTAVLQTIDGQLMAAPFPPSSRFLLGTDATRHDLLSRLLYGARNTLTLASSVVALRVLIGGLLGGIAGWRGGWWGDYALLAAAVSSPIPSLLFAWVFIVAIGPGAGFGVFVLGLGLTGWSHWTHLLHDEIRRLRLQPFMEAAEAVGIPPQRQLSHYIMPNLLPLVIATLAQEMAAAMLLLAELGFLGVFYGSGTVISPANLEQAAFSVEFHDWAGMLAGTRFEVFRYWWLPLAPAGAFCLAIIGFHLLGDGLCQALDPINRLPHPAIMRRFARLFARPRAHGQSRTITDDKDASGAVRQAPRYRRPPSSVE